MVPLLQGMNLHLTWSPEACRGRYGPLTVGLDMCVMTRIQYAIMKNVLLPSKCCAPPIGPSTSLPAGNHSSFSLSPYICHVQMSQGTIYHVSSLVNDSFTHDSSPTQFCTQWHHGCLHFCEYILQHHTKNSPLNTFLGYVPMVDTTSWNHSTYPSQIGLYLVIGEFPLWPLVPWQLTSL